MWTVLFRLKPGVTQEQLANWARTAKAMVGKIPGMFPPPRSPDQIRNGKNAHAIMLYGTYLRYGMYIPC